MVDQKSINHESILEESILKIGRVLAVKGRTVEIAVDREKNSSNLLYKGELIKNVSVGGYIKICKGFSRLIGKVEGEYIHENTYSHPEYRNQKDKVTRILTINLLGFFGEKGFERGVKELPLIDNECFLLKKDEFNAVHNFVREGDESINIGCLSVEKGQPIDVGVDQLFASHIGIFGNTGSGKSYTLAKIYRELFLRYDANQKFQQNAKFFLIDFNGEYISENVIIADANKNRFDLSTREADGKDKFPISTENLNDASFWCVFLTATEKTQSPFVKRSLGKPDIDNGKIEELLHNIISNEDNTVNVGVIFNYLEKIQPFLADQIRINLLREKLKPFNGKYKINGKYSDSNLQGVLDDIRECLHSITYNFKLSDDLSEIKKIQLKLIYYYYSEIEKGYSNQDFIAPLITRLEKNTDSLKKVIGIGELDPKKYLTIVSLKNVNTEMKKILPLLFCKELYQKKKEENQKEKYLNIIIDEAHNILSQSSERESQKWKDYRLETFEEIIKEGRKFGVFLTLASQRPYDISPTIISQLHNFFLHRLINNKDIEAVEKSISYLDKISFDSLPILPTGSCVMAGLMAQMPVIVDIGEISPDIHEPKNKTMSLVTNWME